MQASTVKNVRLFCWYLVIDPGNDANFKIDSSGKYLLFKFGDTNNFAQRRRAYAGSNPKAALWELWFGGNVDATQRYVGGNPGKTFEATMAAYGIPKVNKTEFYRLPEVMGVRLRDIRGMICAIAYDDSNIAAAADAMCDYVINDNKQKLDELEQIAQSSPLEGQAH